MNDAIPQSGHSDFDPIQPKEMDLKEIEVKLFNLLAHHKIRDLLKDLCKSNGHSFAEEVEEILYEDRVVWKVCFGGVEQGTTLVSCICIFDLESDEFNYHSQVIDFYGQALESYLRDYQKIPKDL